jgi:predicted nucleic acid-binding protein
MNVEQFPAPFFIDTNIFVYSFDPSARAKQRKAQAIIEFALTSKRGVVSTQVIQEFLNVATRKFSRRIDLHDAQEYLHRVLAPCCAGYPSVGLFSRALALQAITRFAFYDSLIVTAAVSLGCKSLISEDLQDGQEIDGLLIVNPFR